jgi:uridine kinase
MDNRVKMVAIVGGSASGKTWLADRLCERLGSEKIARISQDDFYRDLSHMTQEEREKVNFDHPDALDWDVLESVFFNLIRGHSAEVPVYDFATHTRCQDRTVKIEPGATISIWDGLWLLNRPALRPLWFRSYFIHCEAETRLKRRIERDTKERGRTELFVQRQFEEATDPMHRKFVEPQCPLASKELQAPISLKTVDEIAMEILGASS